MLDTKKLKKLIKRADESFLTIDLVNEVFNLDSNKSFELLVKLENLGYIEKSKLPNIWNVAMRGKVLLSKKIERVFQVDSMKNQLTKFLERVEEANCSELYTEMIASVKITSQYPIKEASNGVFVVYSDRRKKLTTTDFHEMTERLVMTSNRRFDNIHKRIGYSSIALHEFLKSRSQIIKLNFVSEDDFNKMGGVVIYKNETE